MKISIIILNFNGLENTLDCLESLRRCDARDHKIELIVVDNNSSDGSQEALSNLKDIDLIINRDNLGYAQGNNVGIKRALSREAEAVLIINNDTIVDKLLLLNLIGALKKGDVVSPKIYFASGFEFHKKRYEKEDLGKVIWFAGGKIDWQNIIGIHLGVDEIDKGQFSYGKEIDFATGACVMVKSEVFEKIGFFDKKYFLYLEDMDFCQRAKKARLKIYFEPKAILWHKNASSSGGSGSDLQDYYITRNRLLFAFKYAKLKTKLLLLKQVACQSGAKARRKALSDFLTFRLGKGTYGI